MDSLKKTPPAHQWVETEDGSLTLYSDNFQENCHSHSGARAETQFHYIDGCQVQKLYQELEYFTLLEVGLGTGLGLQMTVDALDQLPIRPYTLVSTEIDASLVEFLVNESPFGLFKKLVKQDNLFCSKDEFGREVIILIGDARKTVPLFFKSFPRKINAIYQDAFSPRRNPDLWTVEWFKDLKEISDENVRLSTYSASSSMRKSMIEAGWKLANGPKFGQKRSSTRARLVGETEPDVTDRLSRSPIGPITDELVKNFKLGNPKI